MTDSEHATCRHCGVGLSADDAPGLCVRCQLSDAPPDRCKVPPAEPACHDRARGTRIPALVACIVGMLVLGGLWLRQRREQPAALLSHGKDLINEYCYDEAIAAFREAIRLRPDDAEAYCHMGIALDRQFEHHGGHRLASRGDPARSPLRQGPPEPGERPVSRAGRGEDYQVKLDEVVAEYREAIRLDPGFGDAYYRLGKALAAQGKVAEAIAAYDKAIELRAGGENIYYDRDLLGAGRAL